MKPQWEIVLPENYDVFFKTLVNIPVDRYRIYDPYRELKEAYERGEEIQAYDKRSNQFGYLVKPLLWNLPVDHYRIKPKEPKYVPFTFEDRDLFMGKQIRLERAKEMYTITHCNDAGVGWPTFNKSDSISFKNGLERLTFSDGTPFGKLVE